MLIARFCTRLIRPVISSPKLKEYLWAHCFVLFTDSPAICPLMSTILGLPGIPAEAEQLMIGRDLMLNRTIGCRYHVQHISTAWSVELVSRAKRDGHADTDEVAPHNL